MLQKLLTAFESTVISEPMRFDNSATLGFFRSSRYSFTEEPTSFATDRLKTKYRWLGRRSKQVIAKSYLSRWSAD